MKFITFPAHGFNQNAQVQFTTARHLKGIRAFGVADLQCRIRLCFFIDAISQVTRCDELSFFTRERRVINGKDHRHCRFVDGNRRQSFRIGSRRDSFTDLNVFQARHQDNISRGSFGTFSLFNTLVIKELGCAAGHMTAIELNQRNGVAHFNLAAFHATDCHTTQILIIRGRRDQHLEGTFRIHFNRFEVIDDSVI